MGRDKSGKIILYILFAVFLLPAAANSQNDKAPTTDTLLINAGTKIEVYDSLYFFTNDTTLILPDSVVRQNPQLKSYLFYQKIEAQAKKTRITHELYKLAFRRPSYPDTAGKQVIEKPDTCYSNCRGKIIRNIQYNTLNIIGQNVEDTTRISLPRFFSWINRIHPKTKSRVIENNLLFSRYDKVDPLALANSERILRELSAVKDAKINVVPIEGEQDSVDVVVLVQDVFPLGAKIKSSGVDQYDLSLWTVNLMGWGHRFDNTFTFYPVNHNKFSYTRMQYKMPNIRGTFIEGEALIERKDHYYYQGFSLNREYLPVKSSWGGLADIGEKKYRTENPVHLANEQGSDSLVRTDVHFSEKNIAAGYSFRCDHMKFKTPCFLVASPAFSSRYYIDRPDIVNATNFEFQHRSDLLGSITFLRNEFYKSRYINNFGISEDIPYGFRVSLTLGHEWGERSNRPYSGISFSTGNYFKGLGYFYLLAESGSFFRNKHFDQGLADLKLLYFSKLFQSKKNFRSRFSLSSHFITGINRYPGEQMYLLSDEVLKNISRDSIPGQQQLNLTAKFTTFTPYYFYGFSLALEAYANMALIGPGSKSVFRNKVYSGLGVGIKIRNEGLVFETIEFRFTYYPNLPGNDSKRFYLESHTRPVSTFSDFSAEYPGIMPYDYFYN